MKKIIKDILRPLYYCVIYSILYVVGFIIRLFTKVKKRRILCWSYYGKKYSCNPRYITEYLLNNAQNEFDIYWAFTDKQKYCFPKIKTVSYKSLKFLFLLNTSEFIITNARTGMSIFIAWKKRKGQKYIMTWHSSMGIKAIEKDVEEKLGTAYVKMAKEDSKYCDLIFSGCKFRSEIIKRAFWYNGEILEKGTPRNDMLFDKSRFDELKNKIFKRYSIPSNAKILLYAPTFRKDHKLHYYKLDWNKIIKVLNSKFNEEFYILFRLHPNLIGQIQDNSFLINNPNVKDTTLYDDMQELLTISDILITDYSSSIFDMALTYKPVFIYATDYDTYDRGTYLPLDSLPFLFAQNEDQLIKNIEYFDNSTYRNNLKTFITETLGSFENGKACEEFYKWMKNHSIS